MVGNILSGRAWIMNHHLLAAVYVLHVRRKMLVYQRPYRNHVHPLISKSLETVRASSVYSAAVISSYLIYASLKFSAFPYMPRRLCAAESGELHFRIRLPEDPVELHHRIAAKAHKGTPRKKHAVGAGFPVSSPFCKHRAEAQQLMSLNHHLILIKPESVFQF